MAAPFLIEFHFEIAFICDIFTVFTDSFKFFSAIDFQSFAIKQSKRSSASIRHKSPMVVIYLALYPNYPIFPINGQKCLRHHLVYCFV